MATKDLKISVGIAAPPADEDYKKKKKILAIIKKSIAVESVEENVLPDPT